MKFYIENDRMMFRGETVYHESGKTEKLTTILFRDGIRWIEFISGIQSDKLTEFFKILKKYRILDEDADGDLVTALWEANFPHLKYEAEDVFWEGRALGIEELFRAERSGKENQEPEAESEISERQAIAAHPISNLISDNEIWKLDAAEIAILQQMIFHEENDDTSKDVLDVLMIILREQKTEEDFKVTFEFLKREFQEVFRRSEFEALTKFLRQLHEFANICQTEKTWASPLFDKFFLDISGPELTDLLKHIGPMSEGFDSNQILQFRSMFRYMLPESVISLGLMLSESKFPPLRHCIMEIIGFMAKKDIRPVENLLNIADEELKKRLIYILGYLKTPQAQEVLIEIISDTSESVRKYALSTLLSTEYDHFESLVLLLDHPSETIRKMILEYIGRRKDAKAEKALLVYLQQCQFQNKDHKFILACFRTLGKCGSDRSLAFLEPLLFEHSWSSLLSSDCSLEREAAAYALAEIGTAASNTLLAKACKSLIPAIRQAYRKATEGSDE
ncbi:MAG: HEAT repeat domain-containing protein [Desulfobacteraceae bacterium]|nr:HEAT repeat domain-containing protein [Desulfobacteraceae bacterium]